MKRAEVDLLAKMISWLSYFLSRIEIDALNINS